jgi:hypothetical protein
MWHEVKNDDSTSIDLSVDLKDNKVRVRVVGRNHVDSVFLSKAQLAEIVDFSQSALKYGGLTSD